MSTSKEELAFVLFMVSGQTEKGRNTPASLYIYNKDLVSYVMHDFIVHLVWNMVFALFFVSLFHVIL